MILLDRLFPRKTRRARELYDAVVGQAREAAFYRDHCVPDTLDGRFDMIVLHLFLVVARLRRVGREGEALAQALLEAMVDNMDSTLREIGVGDLSVGKRVKAMADAYHGRARAYEEAMQSADPDVLGRVLRRNLFGTVENPAAASLAAIAGYMRDQRAALDRMDGATLLDGTVSFVEPPGVAAGEGGGVDNAG